MARLVIGTVQFGLDYGIQGREKVPFSDVVEILRMAAANGVTVLDTAAAYGDSETVLGRSMAKTGYQYQVITKLNECKPGMISDHVKISLERLRVKKLYGCMFHDFSALSDNLSCYHELEECCRDGLIEKAGVSLYHPEEWDFLRGHGIVPQLVQVPYNLFDRRFFRTFPAMRQLNTEIHVRSVFLQGLFFMPPEKLDIFFESVKPILTELHQLAQGKNISAAELAFRFVAGNPAINSVVVGMVRPEELRENLRLIKQPILTKYLLTALSMLALTDEKIILPYNWPTK